MQAVLTTPHTPVGKVKSFGEIGEQYEVLKPLCPAKDGDWWVEIVLVKTGEHAEYLLTHINEDPDAR